MKTLKERSEKILSIQTDKERIRLLYEWTKTNVITYKEFESLISLFTKS